MEFSVLKCTKIDFFFIFRESVVELMSSKLSSQ